MIRYAKGPPPAGLTALAATPGMTWNGLGAADRSQIREALVRDQGALCAYCQRRIGLATDPASGRPKMKIEHWLARSAHGEHQLRWVNLLGVCLGGADEEAGRAPVVVHCDESRANAALFLHPVENQGPDPSAHLVYAKNGEVRSATGDPRVDRDVRALNLNAPKLKRARTEIFDALWKVLKRSEFRTQELRRIAKAHRIVAGAVVPEQAGFVRYHVLKKLRHLGESE